MKIHTAIFVAATGLLFSCGLFRHSQRTGNGGLPEGYNGGDAVTYYYTEGVKYDKLDGDPLVAATRYRQALKLDSLHAPSYYGLAGDLARSDVQSAIRYARKAQSLDTTNNWYLGQVGRLYLMSKDYGSALSIYRQMVRRDPQDPDNYRLLAALYKMNAQPFSAIAVLDTAEEKLGRIEGLSAYKRQLLIETRQYDKAIDQAQALVEEYPYSVGNYISLAEVYGRTGKDSLAMANYGKALAIDSSDVDIYVSMNEFYKQKEDIPGFTSSARKIFLSRDVTLADKIDFLGDLRSNQEFYRSNFPFVSDLAATLAVMYPDSLSALTEYVRVLAASDKANEASRLLKSFLQREEKPDLETLNMIIQLETMQERPDSVDKYMSLALKYYPDDFDLRVRKAMTEAQMKRYGDALSTYEQAMKLARSDSVRGMLYGMMGDVAHLKQDTAGAYEYYDKALHKYPNNAMVLNNYAYYLAEERKHLDKALKMSKRSMELMDGEPSFIDTYGWILYQTGDYEQARKAIRQAISLDRRNSAELAFHYGEILYALKDYFMASVYWRKALERGYDKDVIEQRLKLVEGK